MSLNARPPVPRTSTFPTWSDLARTIVDHLYAEQAGGPADHREEALAQASATSGFLRLAQEYEAAFGRDALDRLIVESVPDLQFEPGDLHVQLLLLPWADVFTTNWDTLLERAATRVVDRHYDLVRAPAEIPGSRRPRIVKLHGTLPTIRPFIFTEEDFRTFPTRFGPFVNLAQQAMMESIFCLLGFSGDDPNFLYWSGWVRDHLGSHSPRIYLVGWLDLPPPRRRMFESRGIVPVDLAHLELAGQWPKELQRRYAIEWFLRSLAEAEPYPEKDWPSVPDRATVRAPEYLPPRLVETADRPQKEPIAPSNDREPSAEELLSLLEVWRHNRLLYPGWLVAPSSARYLLWWHTEHWIPAVLGLLPQLSGVERIQVLGELNWRMERCLVPLTPALIASMSDALSGEGGENRPTACRGYPVTASELGRFRVELGAALLRAARERDDDAEMERWCVALEPQQSHYTWLGPRMAYERCLLAMARLDHAAAREAPEDLDIESDDAFWKVRKAGILAELGDTEAAFRLTGEALPEIRQRIRKDVTDIPLLSREGWAMMLAEGFTFYPHPREPWWEREGAQSGPRGVESPDQAARRWDVLRRHECDARDEMHDAWRAVQGPPPVRQTEAVERLGFDPGQRTRWGPTRHSRDPGWEYLPALQAKRLIEETGMPAVADRVDLAKSILLRTAVWLTDEMPQMALGTILRVSDYENNETFDDFFTRSRIALLKEEEVGRLTDRLQCTLKYGVPRAVAATAEEDNERAAYWLGRVRVAVDLLSRLALRLSSEKADRVLDQALEFHQLPLFREHHWLVQPLASLFYRTLTALDPPRIPARLAAFVGLPVASEKGFDTDSPSQWPDPFCLAAWRLGDRPGVPLVGPEWARAVDRLVAVAADSPQRYPRSLAIRRLEVLLRWGALTTDQAARFGEAIWAHRYPGGGLPEETGFEDFVLLILPAPDRGLADGLIRERSLSLAVTPHSLPMHGFLQTLLGVAQVQEDGRTSVQLSANQLEGVLEAMLAGWRSGHLRQATESDDNWHTSFAREDYMEDFAGVLGRVILPRVDPSSARIDEAVSMISDLRGLGFPVELAYPMVVRLRPGLLPEIADRLRQSLVSPQKYAAEAGVKAILWWLLRREELGLESPPVDLVLEIAIAVSMRRPSCLREALRAAEWILRNCPGIDLDRFGGLVAEGLAYLLGEASYEASLARDPAPRFGPNEIATLRTLCVQAALALQAAGFGELQPVAEWIRRGQTDPLPEVRHAFSEGFQLGP